MILLWGLTPARLVLPLYLIVLGLAGCASVARTEGTSGPIAWRVSDLGIVTRNIQGQSVDTYDFTLVIKNVSGRSLRSRRCTGLSMRPVAVSRVTRAWTGAGNWRRE